MLRDIRGSSMLGRTSRFVLEVLPYLLSALIAAVVVPAFLYSQAHGTKAPGAPSGLRLVMIHWDNNARLSLDSDKPADGVSLR
jgi:hypothetical protein